MAEEKGVVISVGGDGWAQVTTERKEACAGCGAAHFCHALGGGTEMVSRALNKAGARAGDLVELNLSSATLIKSVAVLYLIPLAGLVAGALTGSGLDSASIMSETNRAVLCSVAGLLLGLFITFLISRKMSGDNRLAPVITRIIKAGDKDRPSPLYVDPVCGKLVSPTDPSLTATRGDRIFHFCSSRCRETFLAKPSEDP